MHKIKVINNFISEDDANKYIDYIDTNLDRFYKDASGLRYAWMFGKDYFHRTKSAPDTQSLSSIMPELLPIFDRVLEEVRSAYAEDEMYITSFWFGKQDPGAKVDGHYDVDDGSNTHMKYSGIVYLDKTNNDGHLHFKNIGYTYQPVQSDLVIFPSDGEDYWHEVDKISYDRHTLLFWFTTDKDFELEIVY